MRSPGSRVASGRALSRQPPCGCHPDEQGHRIGIVTPGVSNTTILPNRSESRHDPPRSVSAAPGRDCERRSIGPPKRAMSPRDRCSAPPDRLGGDSTCLSRSVTSILVRLTHTDRRSVRPQRTAARPWGRFAAGRSVARRTVPEILVFLRLWLCPESVAAEQQGRAADRPSSPTRGRAWPVPRVRG
jgi:hypothetical protein